MPVSLLRCLLLATVLTTAPLLARAEIIELPFSMAKGEVLELTVTSRTDQTRGGREQWKESFETGTVEVIDLLDDGYLVEMTLLESRHDASQSVMKDMALAMADGLNGRAVQFELNENGVPVRVIGWHKLMDDIASIARGSEAVENSPQLRQVLEMLETDPPELKFEQSYEFDRASGRARRMTQVQTIAMGVLASQEERREITVRRR